MATCDVSQNIPDAMPARTSPVNDQLVKRFSFLNDQQPNSEILNDTSYRGADDDNYSQAWFTHYKRREHLFKPWSQSLGPLGSKWESLRLQAINNYWRTVGSNRVSPVSVHLSVWFLNKLLWCLQSRFMSQNGDKWFAGIVAVALRTALKFEERPETLWGIRRIWDVLPMLESWNIDRSDHFLILVEAEALRLVDDCLDAPLSVQFFDKYVAVGGWPAEMTKDYTALGHFLLALATFSGGDSHPLMNVSPSKLAAAAVVLSVKIVNGDSRRSYEFFPDRFAAFCQVSMKELQPAIKGLSGMLRRKPAECGILSRVYQEWGEHEWQ